MKVNLIVTVGRVKKIHSITSKLQTLESVYLRCIQNQIKVITTASALAPLCLPQFRPICSHLAHQATGALAFLLLAECTITHCDSVVFLLAVASFWTVFFSRSHMAHFCISFRPLIKCHFLREAGPDEAIASSLLLPILLPALAYCYLNLRSRLPFSLSVSPVRVKALRGWKLVSANCCILFTPRLVPDTEVCMDERMMHESWIMPFKSGSSGTRLSRLTFFLFPLCILGQAP